MSSSAFHVTLRSLDGLDAIKERKVFLSPDEPVMVGRSSKTPTKNLTPAADNTWIDSPIVSREHALLSVADSHAGVNVRSLGMHGTYLNGDELGKNKDQKLESGAILQLGSSISRGDETFRPHKYSVHIDSLPTLEIKETQIPGGTTFTYPYSDDESELADEDENEADLVEDNLSQHSHDSYTSELDLRSDSVVDAVPKSYSHVCDNASVDSDSEDSRYDNDDEDDVNSVCDARDPVDISKEIPGSLEVDDPEHSGSANAHNDHEQLKDMPTQHSMPQWPPIAFLPATSSQTVANDLPRPYTTFSRQDTYPLKNDLADSYRESRVNSSNRPWGSLSDTDPFRSTPYAQEVASFGHRFTDFEFEPSQPAWRYAETNSPSYNGTSTWGSTQCSSWPRAEWSAATPKALSGHDALSDETNAENALRKKNAGLRKKKNGISIDDILQNQTSDANACAGDKRKASAMSNADEIEKEAEERYKPQSLSVLGKEQPKTMQPNIGQARDNVVVAWPTKVPKSRNRSPLRGLGTFTAGALVGGVSILATLIALPEAWLQ